MVRQAGGIHPDADERRGRDDGDDDGLEREIDAVRIPNAAPLFSACVMSSSPGMMVMLSWTGNASLTSAFVA